MCLRACVSAAAVPSLPTHRFLFIFLYRNVTFSYVTVVRKMFSLLPILGFVCELGMGFCFGVVFLVLAGVSAWVRECERETERSGWKRWAVRGRQKGSMPWKWIYRNRIALGRFYCAKIARSFRCAYIQRCWKVNKINVKGPRMTSEPAIVMRNAYNIL